MKAKLLLGVAITIGTLSTVPVSGNAAPSKDDKTSSASTTGKPDIKLIGYVRTDAVFNINDTVAHPSGTTFSSARFGVKGSMNPYISYVVDFEFGKGASGKIKDAYLTYKATDKLSVRLGQAKDQTSLGFFSSVKHRPFADVALNASLVPGTRTGLTTFYGGKNYSATISVTGEGAEKIRAADEGYAVSGRFSYAPVLTDSSVFHLGLAAAWQKPTDEKGYVDYSAKHEASVTTFKSIKTDKIRDVDSTFVTNVDVFAKTGSFWAMGEYTRNKVNRRAGLDDVTFDAWYAQAGWILTGENRPYSPRYGVDGIKPISDLTEGGPGALELAARYDTLDLNDGLIQGGKIDRYSVSLNWYPVKYVQLRASYQKSSASASAILPKDKPQAVILRAAWVF